jgi:ribosomal protein S18 acetylase RimI-like enzyme
VIDPPDFAPDVADVMIAPIGVEHIGGFHQVLQTVARERIYLAMTEVQPLPWAEDFVHANIRHRHAQFVALADGAVVGWCDIVPHALTGFTHAGALGMGLLPDWRGRGIGKRLLAATLQAALAAGLTRIELDVYGDNTAAIGLYRHFGFIEEGRKRCARLLDGAYQDVLIMALLVGAASIRAPVPQK